MNKLIIWLIFIVLISIVSGIFPSVAVAATAIVIVGLFLIFGKEY